MNYPKYPLVNTPENTKFSFKSTGPKGDIDLAVVFTPDTYGIYHLALGVLLANNEVDDTVVVANGDRDKILATVEKAISSFFSTHPNEKVFFVGNTVSRTRLYQRTISLNLAELQQVYIIFGLFDNLNPIMEPFTVNKNYDAFLIVRKV